MEHPLPLRDMPKIDTLIIGVNIDRDDRRRKISERLKHRLDDGFG